MRSDIQSRNGINTIGQQANFNLIVRNDYRGDVGVMCELRSFSGIGSIVPKALTRNFMARAMQFYTA